MPFLNANFFSSEEENFLIRLKEEIKPELTWQEIHKNYKKEFPSSPRSKGGLQVHYSRKLQPCKRKARQPVASQPALSDIDIARPSSPCASFSTPTASPSAPSPINSASSVSLSNRSIGSSIFSASPATPTPSRKSARVNARIARKRSPSTVVGTKSDHKVFEDSDSSVSPIGPLSTPNLSPIIYKDIDMKELVVAMKVQTSSTSPDASNPQNTTFTSLNASPSVYPGYTTVRDSIENSSSNTKVSRQVPSRNAKRTSLLDEYPVILEGWVPADMEVLRRIEGAPRFFTHPPDDRVVEFNTRSKAYRIRSRMEFEELCVNPTVEHDAMEE